MNTLSRVDVFLTALLVGLPTALDQSIASVNGEGEGSSKLARAYPLGAHPRLSELPPRTRKLSKRRRPKPTSSSVKLPPPSTPFFLRIALGLWSILLAFWRSLVGETRAERKRLTRKRADTLRGTNRLLQELEPAAGQTTDDGSGSGTDGEAVGEDDEDEEGTGAGKGMKKTPSRKSRRIAAKAKSAASASASSGVAGVIAEPGTAEDEWVDPVTRAPPDQPGVEQPDDDEFVPPTIPSPIPAPEPITFRLRSAVKSDSPPRSLRASLENLDTQRIPLPFISHPGPPGILANATPRTRRLLPNPMSTSLLDPSVPVTSIPATVKLHPLAKPHQTPFHLQKTLILDLDETLIHSTSRPMGYSSNAGGGLIGLSFGGLLGGRKSRREGHTVEVVLGGRSTTYHVYKRPYVDHFLKKVANWYTLVIYTASMPEYADPVIDWLDGGRGLFAKRLYRESCFLQRNGSYIKDLSLVEQDLSRVCFMDNSPISYLWNKPNALPIEGWTSDPYDEALLQSIPVLDSLRFVNDVRSVLGIRGF